MQLRRALWEALAGIAAVLASFLTMYAIGAGVSAGPSAAIVAAVLALTLWRRASSTHASPWLTLAMLASIAVAAALVGRLLATHPVLGAAVFVVAIAASIWLRQYGRRAAEIGSLIALPFVVMLIAPVRPDALGGPWVDLALVVCAGAAAFGWTTVVRLVSTRLGLMRAEVPSPLSRDAPASRSGLNVSVRMALQMAVALTAAFAIGFWAFPMHWGWVVLTAFIVCSGARGRGDAAYKGLLRLVGALAGTIGAAVLAHVALPNGVAAAAAIFAALFLGMWLRERSYAYWAACVTLALALLQHLEGEQAMALLLGRIEGIFVGAVCAVAATWFVYPFRHGIGRAASSRRRAGGARRICSATRMRRATSEPKTLRWSSIAPRKWIEPHRRSNCTGAFLRAAPTNIPRPGSKSCANSLHTRANASIAIRATVTIRR